MVTNVYSQYFKAKCSFNGIERYAARVFLTADSEAGNISYTANVTFFPHTTPDDFSVSYDSLQTKNLYSAAGRRSKKREAELLKTLRTEIDLLAQGIGATVFWEEPLKPADYA